MRQQSAPAEHNVVGDLTTLETTSRIESASGEAGDNWMSDNDGSPDTGRLLVRIDRHMRLFYFKYPQGRSRPTTGF